MKKLLSISILFYYLVITIGLFVNIHYCKGEVKSIKIGTNNNSSCCAADICKSSCCDDELLLIRHDNEHKIVQSHNTSVNLYAEKIHFITNNNIDEYIDNEPIRFIDIPPPKNVPTWILNSSLTFYG